MSQPDIDPDALQVRRRRWTRWLWVPVLLIALGAGWWWRIHPADLPNASSQTSGEIKAGQTLYLRAADDPHRSREITIDDVALKVSNTPGQSAEVSLWVCRGGSIGQTTTPERFCDSWRKAEGATANLGGGDVLVVGVRADQPGTVTVDRITLDFSDGLQRGSSRIGAPLTVNVLG
ncbi:hypothetical protein ACLM5J_10300 [Nocardioides sp. Bht2]|uniref:hypothetical protein n=1 Tax=Nocardioides sp. Bht2 TaxID=3392297 RepID=UPI0039B61A1B